VRAVLASCASGSGLGSEVDEANAAESLWRRACRRLETKVGSRYEACFGEVVARRVTGDVLTLGVPNAFVRDHILERYRPLLEVAVGEAAGAAMRVELELIPSTGRDANSAPSARSAADLNPRYRFSTFVVGAGNQLAHAAALKVAEAPGQTLNPLLLHGETGLGKTHLLQATARHAAERPAASRVRYVTAEAFLNDFVRSVSDRRAMPAFRERYRGVEVLLLDDVQFFAGKERVQEELLHTFTALYERGRQIVLSSDRPPRDLGPIDSGLCSRFEMGLLAEVRRPDLATRAAILAKLAEAQELAIGDPALLPFIAGRVTRNVRELQGALTRLAAHSSLMGRKLDLDLARELLPDEKETEVSIERVEEVVAARFGLPLDELRGRRRTTSVVYPRHLAMHLARQLTGASLLSIGRHFGRDHTTVMYADRRVRRQIRDDPEARDLVEELSERVRQRR